jgi:hypothetical protein
VLKSELLRCDWSMTPVALVAEFVQEGRFLFCFVPHCHFVLRLMNSKAFDAARVQHKRVCRCWERGRGQWWRFSWFLIKSIAFLNFVNACEKRIAVLLCSLIPLFLAKCREWRSSASTRWERSCSRNYWLKFSTTVIARVWERFTSCNVFLLRTWIKYAFIAFVSLAWLWTRLACKSCTLLQSYSLPLLLPNMTWRWLALMARGGMGTYYRWTEWMWYIFICAGSVSWRCLRRRCICICICMTLRRGGRESRRYPNGDIDVEKRVQKAHRMQDQ